MTENTITKFQELDVGVSYTVVGFKPVKSKFGDAYILEVRHGGTGNNLKTWASNGITEYLNDGNNCKIFDFTVRQIRNGKFTGKNYAEIKSNDGDGFIKLK